MTVNEIYDVIIIGSGPSAYSAALYLRKYSVLMLEGCMSEGVGPGGQLTTTTMVDNYPGYPDGVMGPDLIDIMKRQVESKNLTIKTELAIDINKHVQPSCYIVKTRRKHYYTRSVIIATGANAKKLDVPGADVFWQQGISTCAVCDGYIFANKTVAVVGGGDTSMEESLYMSKIAKQVYLIHRRDIFRSRKDMLLRAEKEPKIKILRSFVLDGVFGDTLLRGICVRNLKTNEIERISVDGLFFAIGHVPNTSFCNRGFIDMDSEGYIMTNDAMETNRAGIFACGDVQDKVYRQANTAAASGCIAALSATKYLDASAL